MIIKGDLRIGRSHAVPIIIIKPYMAMGIGVKIIAKAANMLLPPRGGKSSEVSNPVKLFIFTKFYRPPVLLLILENLCLQRIHSICLVMRDRWGSVENVA